MRHFPIVFCATALLSGYASAGAPGSLVFSLDVLAPCNQSGCTGTHPTDMGFTLNANAFSYASANGAFVSALGIDSPVVCDEVAAGNVLGPASMQRLAPSFNNASPGGLLEFNAGGPNVIDIGALSYFGSSPAGVAASYSNYGVTLPPQVACYQINPVTGGPVQLASGPGDIFSSGFDVVNKHFADEPWISVQTVVSPLAVAGRGQTSGTTDSNAMNYVVQVHNASSAVNWHLAVGYDYAFFDPANNSLIQPKWCVLGANTAMPGPIAGSCAHNGTVSSAYTIAAGDIHSDTNSVYIYMQYEGSSTAVAGWNTLGGNFIPAVAALFPPFSTYAQRFDDKVAVASANNHPTINIGSIVCNNDVSSTSCTLRDQDGNALPSAVKFQNSISSGGAAIVDPVAYLVDPTSDSTLPGNIAADALTINSISCTDPSGILAGGISGSNFATSPSALGGKALSFNFTPSGSPDFPFKSGTANCTAMITASGYAPSLSTTGSFTVSMQQAAVGSVAVTANAAQTATPGGTVGYTLHVANAGSAALSNVLVTNPIAANVASLSWTCTPAGGASCPAASGSGVINQMVATLPVGGSLNYAITQTLVGAASFVSAAQVSDAASISVPGGSCSGGNCNSSASVNTVPIIHLTLAETPSSYANSGDPVTYTITAANEGGTDATGLTVANPGVAGLTFTAWTCTATGATSSCPNAAGAGGINESGIAVAAGGSVVYSLQGTVTVTSGNITDTVTVGPGGTVCFAGVCTAQQTLSGPP